MDVKNLLEKLSRDERKELLGLLQVEIKVPKFVNIPLVTHKVVCTNELSPMQHLIFFFCSV
jgi:hypothetical protein